MKTSPPKKTRQTGELHALEIAHDLKNPLTGALTALHALKGPVRRHPQALDLLETCLGRMRGLIDYMLVDARAGAEPKAEVLELETEVRAVIGGVGFDAREKQIKLEARVPAGHYVKADPRLFTSALTNLVTNAIKFSPSGGTVTIRSRLKAGKILLEVEDTCGGLPKGKAEELFKPFVQTGKDRTGFGMGLAIVKRVSDACGGSLSVANKPGKGCIFCWELPSAPKPPRPSEIPTAHVDANKIGAEGSSSSRYGRAASHDETE